MAIVDDLNRIRDWLQTEVCDHVELKVPDEEERTEGYDYELVKPTAFVLFTPSKDRLPPNVRAPVPSVCVRIAEGEHRPMDGRNTMRLVLNFCTWNPGLHRRDNFIPIEGSGMKGYNVSATAEYQRSVDGWQDVYSFIDRTLRAIENAEYIAGLRVVTEDGIKYGMATESLDEFYPYWPAWIEFSVQGGLVRARDIENLL